MNASSDENKDDERIQLKHIGAVKKVPTKK